MDLISSLNDAQRKAVITTDGPVMVMAGAGSGKTKVLTTRIAYIINELGINPYSILAVTFTNKAAGEMKERIAKLVNLDTKWMWISTFHSFCVRVLRSEIEALPGYNKSFTIIDDDDQKKIVNEIIKKCDLACKAKDMLNYISKEKNGMDFTIRDWSLRDDYNTVKGEYNRYLKSNNLLDFDDLIIKTIEIFEVNPEVLFKYQNQFKYIMVDEFQDTNKIQYKLIHMLAIKSRNVFVVGDDFQSIYSFRGAQIENINKFRVDFSETELILLEKNYRSTTEILNLANCIIENNPNQIKKVLKSNDSHGNKPIFYRGMSSYDEVMYIVSKIKEHNKDGKSYSDMAILYRSNYLAREIEDILVRNQIPYKIYGGISFYQRKEIKDMIAYLRLINNKEDDFSFRRIVNEPKRKIGDAIISKLDNIAIEKNLSLFESIPFYTGQGQGATNLKLFMDMIDSISAELNNVKLPDVIEIILNETGYREALKDEYKDDKESFNDRMDNINELKSVLKESEEFYEGSNKDKLTSMLQDLALRTDADNVDEKIDAVRLSTFHQAKGLEFDTVFMPAMENGIFPSDNIESAFELEEERRICYVGLTRAKRNLYLTCSAVRTKFGMTSSLPVSCFIDEMDENLYVKYKKPISKPSSTVSSKPINNIYKKPEPKVESNDPDSINTGDKINHKAFGDGIVVAKAGSIITVAFKAEIGIKKLSATHPAIRKL